MPYDNPSLGQEPMGPPKFFDVSLPAYHSLWTPADLPILAIMDALVLPSVYVKTLGVRNKLISKLYQHFRARAAPTAYGILCLRLARLVRRPKATPPRTQDSIRVGG